MEEPIVKKAECSCKWKSCKRYGKCDECMQYHSQHPKHPLPFCKKQKKTPPPEQDA